MSGLRVEPFSFPPTSQNVSIVNQNRRQPNHNLNPSDLSFTSSSNPTTTTGYPSTFSAPRLYDDYVPSTAVRFCFSSQLPCAYSSCISGNPRGSHQRPSQDGIPISTTGIASDGFRYLSYYITALGVDPRLNSYQGSTSWGHCSASGISYITTDLYHCNGMFLEMIALRCSTISVPDKKAGITINL
jgi:hypothetical protein